MKLTSRSFFDPSHELILFIYAPQVHLCQLYQLEKFKSNYYHIQRWKCLHESFFFFSIAQINEDMVAIDHENTFKKKKKKIILKAKFKGVLGLKSGLVLGPRSNRGLCWGRV